MAIIQPMKPVCVNSRISSYHSIPIKPLKLQLFQGSEKYKPNSGSRGRHHGMAIMTTREANEYQIAARRYFDTSEVAFLVNIVPT